VLNRTSYLIIYKIGTSLALVYESHWMLEEEFNALQINIRLRFSGLPSGGGPFHGPHCPSAYRRGDARAAAGTCLCVDTRILRVGWCSLRLGARTMGAGSMARSPLGPTALGPPPWRMGVYWRAMALANSSGAALSSFARSS
jgi:hypothetical protein